MTGGGTRLISDTMLEGLGLRFCPLQSLAGMGLNWYLDVLQSWIVTATLIFERGRMDAWIC